MENMDGSELNLSEVVNSFKIKISYAYRKADTVIDVNTDLSMDNLVSDLTIHLKSGVFGYAQENRMVLIPTNQILKLEVIPSSQDTIFDAEKISECKNKIMGFLESETCKNPKRFLQKIGYQSDIIELALIELIEETKITGASWGKYRKI